MFLHCKAFAKHRATTFAPFPREIRLSLPTWTRRTGISTCSLDILTNYATSCNAQADRFEVGPLTDEDFRTQQLTAIDGKSWVIAAIYGAASSQQRRWITRAGAGVYYGPDHSRNQAITLHGSTQDSYGAEVCGVMLAVRKWWMPTCDHRQHDGTGNFHGDPRK